LKLGLALKNDTGKVVDHISGYPQEIKVKKLPNFHLQTPREIFSASSFVAALSCEDEEFEAEDLVVKARTESGQEIPVVVNGTKLEFSLPEDFTGKISVDVILDGILIGGNSQSFEVKRKPTLRWYLPFFYF
jgi:hypothetical protein